MADVPCPLGRHMRVGLGPGILLSLCDVLWCRRLDWSRVRRASSSLLDRWALM